MDISIVLLNFNGAHFLLKFLPPLLLHSPGASVYVIDNASTDGSQKLKDNFPEVTWIQLDNNLGFAGGYNEGLKQVQGKYWLLLNTDVLVSANWLEPLWDLMESNPLIAACQPKVLSYHDQDSFEYAGAGGGHLDYLGFPFCRGRLFDVIEKDKRQYDDSCEVFWASGAAFLVRPEDFLSAGGFDVDFFAHMEEIDLCWRFHRLNKLVYYCGASTVYHVGGGTLNQGHPFKTYLNFRNNLALLYKNYSPIKFWGILWKKLTFDLIASLKFLAGGHWGSFASVYRAHFHFWRKLRSWRKKKQAFGLLADYNHTKLYPKSIVWEHFLLGKTQITLKDVIDEELAESSFANADEV